MGEQNPDLAKNITEEIAKRLERSKSPIPIGISNRHFHLNQDDWDVLFGKGTEPKKFRDVKQPGFWAAYETVSIEGPKGKLDNIRLVAPHRSKTQIEISKTDAQILGLKPPIRDSGDLAGSTGVKVIGPKGTLTIKEGLILARRHIHFHPLEAKAMNIKDGEVVRVRAGIGGIRELVFEQVLCRVSDKFSLELHLDTDEANAALVKNGDMTHIC
jgi:propanediol utilization protein